MSSLRSSCNNDLFNLGVQKPSKNSILEEELPSKNSRNEGRIILVSSLLPVKAHRDELTKQWCFEFDDEALVYQLKEGLPRQRRRELIYYVGFLDVDISDPIEQREVAALLKDKFHCIPTFWLSATVKNLYHGFCNNCLWPLFHDILLPTDKNVIDKGMWEAYKSTNNSFADSIIDVVNETGDDYVWIHGFALMMLPTFLREKIPAVKLGFFLHIPFPEFEIYRTLPWCNMILKSLLNCDLIGFQLFNYARQFLSCCRRLLGLNHELKRGDIAIEFNGRVVSIMIQHIGIDMGQIEHVKSMPETAVKVKELKDKFKGKIVFIGNDDVDVIKGINLKFLAMGQLLEEHPELRGSVVLVQILKPASSWGPDIKVVEKEIDRVAREINSKYGVKSSGYEPIVCIKGPVSNQDKVAYYVISECCFVNSVKDGWHMVPYKYTVSRQGNPQLDEALGLSDESASKNRKSFVVISEFVGCSKSLTGAIKVNPLHISEVAEALYKAIVVPENTKRMYHQKHYQYVIISHDIVFFAGKFFKLLQKACGKNTDKKCLKEVVCGLKKCNAIRFGTSLRRLWDIDVVSSYKKSNSRLILLDYDGTLMPQEPAAGFVDKSPSDEVICLLNNLCSDPMNVVFIVSGRGKKTLSSWFAPCKLLGLSAEHGYFMRWNGYSAWEEWYKLMKKDFEWKELALSIMEIYTELTEGSYIEEKECGLVWHYEKAAGTFGEMQARELLDHLASLLAKDAVVAKKGLNIVEVRVPGLSKGLVTTSLVEMMKDRGKLQPDFVLCIGNDQSDEDMFESAKAIATATAAAGASAKVFSCTVGVKPSVAEYFLNDPNDVIKMLRELTATSTSPKKATSP